MENTDKSQESLDIYRVRKLLKKIRIKTDERNRNPYTTNKKRSKMTMEITREESVLEDQETSIEITINTTFRFKPFINYGNERLELYNRDDVISGKRITDVYVKKDDDYGTKLRDYEKENVCHRTRD